MISLKNQSLTERKRRMVGKINTNFLAVRNIPFFLVLHLTLPASQMGERDAHGVVRKEVDSQPNQPDQPW